MRNKLVLSFVALCLFSVIAFAETVRIELGMSGTEVINTITALGGEDITSGMEITANESYPPPSGIYWSLREYNAVLAFSGSNDKLESISYWNSEDFDLSKMHRAQTEQFLTSLTFDTDSKHLVPVLKK